VQFWAAADFSFELNANPGLARLAHRVLLDCCRSAAALMLHRSGRGGAAMWLGLSDLTILGRVTDERHTEIPASGSCIGRAVRALARFGSTELHSS